MKRPMLMIFYRNPILGQVKTRLAATIGQDKALAIYLHLAHHTRQVTVNLSMEKTVYYSDYIDTEDAWDNHRYKKLLQQGEGLGVRMAHAFSEMFEAGFGPMVIIGTDCFELNERIVRLAFDQLEGHDLVLGPARDGGYYLLGMNEYHPELFMGKTWGSGSVTKETLDTALALGLDYTLLPELGDVDTEEDLPEALRKLIWRQA